MRFFTARSLLGSWLVCTVLALAARAEEPAPALKIETTADMKVTVAKEGAPPQVQQGVILGCVYLLDGKAVVFDGGPDDSVGAVFDFAQKAWREAPTDRTITLAQGEAWAEASRQKTLASMKVAKDEGMKKFVGAMIEPNFEISEHDGKIMAKNDVLSMLVTPGAPIDDAWLKQMQAYDLLNAYYKTMRENKWTPATQLELNKELARRKQWPGEVEMTVLMMNVKIEAKTKTKIAALTPQELAAGRKVLAETPGPQIKPAPEKSESKP